jgi:hypothetical protein
MPASLPGRLWYPRRAPQKTAIKFEGVFGANSDAIVLRIASASASNARGQDAILRLNPLSTRDRRQRCTNGLDRRSSAFFANCSA